MFALKMCDDYDTRTPIVTYPAILHVWKKNSIDLGRNGNKTFLKSQNGTS